MPKFSLKPPARHLYRSILEQTRIELDRKHLSRTAIVFSPHQDDETLGCGGTIIRKKQAGADLKIVFVTDGSGSHSHLISAQNLKEIRAREALLAADKLGVDQSDVIFLEFKDGTLARNAAIATEKVKQLLLENLPDEIFVPYANDGVSDHNATNHIVLSALKECGLKVTVYEYPVWFWTHWPWTNCSGKGKQFFSVVNQNFKSGFQLLKEFQYYVDIGDILDQKREALEQHKSQVKKLLPSPNWLTLGDVSNGEFLDCFFQKKEIFCRRNINGESIGLYPEYYGLN